MTYMEQKTIQIQEQEISLERSIGNLFTDFLQKKNRLAEFDKIAENVMVSLDGAVLRGAGGFPAKVKDILKMVIKPTQVVKFLPRNAGG